MGAKGSQAISECLDSRVGEVSAEREEFDRPGWGPKMRASHTLVREPSGRVLW